MTTTAENTFDVAVDVRFSSSGKPLAVRHDDQIWVVTEEPVRFAGPDALSQTQSTATSDSDNQTAEFWQVQVKPSANAAAQTFILRREPPATYWLLESIS